ncbi:MAG: hypothetical protein IPK00_23460 [Deltaproteobacteria bacterium]|nr:hypothetical protein [Deltaproteobacteria bacterium]
MKKEAAALCSMIVLSLWGLPTQVAADGPYSSAVRLEAQGGGVIARHHHDYGERNHAVIWEEFDRRTDQFDPKNRFSRIRITKVGGENLYEGPCPPLNFLWVSPTGDYIVGLSEIRHSNPYQIVVFSRRGDLLVARDVDCHRDGIVGCTETVSKFVFWYESKKPLISVHPHGDWMVLVVDTPDEGYPFMLTFPDVMKTKKR